MLGLWRVEKYADEEVGHAYNNRFEKQATLLVKKWKTM